MSLEVTECDWSKVNGVIYEDNGVVIRSSPAVHFEQSASFILEWNGLKLAFSGDTLPNKWWIVHTKGVDLSIHESIFMPDRHGGSKLAPRDLMTPTGSTILVLFNRPPLAADVLILALEVSLMTGGAERRVLGRGPRERSRHTVAVAP